jgi:hypothetical protein
MSKVFQCVLKLLFGGVEVFFGVGMVLTGVGGIAPALGKIFNGVTKIVDKMFERWGGSFQILLRVLEIFLRVGKVLVLDLAEALYGLPELAANATVFFVEKFVRSFLNDGWELGERTVFQRQSPGRPTFLDWKAIVKRESGSSLMQKPSRSWIDAQSLGSNGEFRQ